MPILSVILPSLNMRNYIGECLKSILSQSFTDLEIISVDAMSSDGTKDILEQYASLDSRIVLKQCDVRSYGKQVNIGIREAKGNYVAVVDTDDYIAPDMYQKLIEKAEKYELDYVKAGYFKHYEFSNGKIYEEKCEIIPENKYMNKIINADECPYMHCWDGYLWAGIYKREFLLKYGITLNESSGAAFQDVGFFHQVTNKAKKVMYIDYYGYYYRINRAGNSISSINGIKYMYDEYARILDNRFIKEEKQLKYVYVKMVYSLMAECEKKAIVEAIDKDVVRIYLDKFIDIIKSKFTLEIINSDDFSQYEMKEIEHLMYDKNSYMDNIRNKIYKKEYFLYTCNELSLNKNIVIFGSGIRGKNIIQLLLSNGVNISYVIDNDCNKWGNSIQNIEIVPLDKVLQEDNVYVIAVKGFENEITKQITDYDISIENIIVPELYG